MSTRTAGGQLFALVFYGILIFVVYQFFTCKDKKRQEKELSRIQAHYSYDLDSLGKAIFYPSSELKENPPKGKTVVYFKEEHGGEVSLYISCNEVLSSDKRAFNVKDLNVITLVTEKEREVGEYNLGAKAIQRYVTIQYIDPKNKTVVYEKEVSGGIPPSQVTRRRTERKIYGSYPNYKVVAEQIQSDLN